MRAAVQRALSHLLLHQHHAGTLSGSAAKDAAVRSAGHLHSQTLIWNSISSDACRSLFEPSIGCAWASTIFVRGLKKSASQLRVGDVLEKEDGQLARVVKFVWNHGQARAQGFILIDTVDLGGTRRRSSSRLKLDEAVTLAELSSREMQVLYLEGSTVHAMCSETYEQVSFPVELFGEVARWLQPETTITVKLQGEEPVAASLPIKMKVRVEEAPPAVVKEDGTSARHVVVTGGISVMAPAHVSKGDDILVNIQECSYIGKA
mmetsp:Transcript_36981/g.82207  ORF Transcript_36981/g.82207 Transcript_36981/m.82207 type:complete len:262 (+) Transcript_36981:48-833(+)